MTNKLRKRLAERLKEMLKLEEPCDCCPGIEEFVCPENVTIRTEDRCSDYHDICRTCQVEIFPDRTINQGKCPCWGLGKDEAIKRARLFVEEMEERGDD